MNSPATNCARTLELIIRDVAELPDRNSPEGWPEAMIVTGDELRKIVSRHLADALAAADAEVERLREECAKAEKLWKTAAIDAERARTTLGGMENAARILDASATRAEAARNALRAALARIIAADECICARQPGAGTMLNNAIIAARALVGK